MRTSRSLLRRGLVAATLLGGIAIVPVILASQADAAVVPVGSGSYRSDRPAGTKGPDDFNGGNVTPKVSDRMKGKPVPTNDWWSSLIWQRFPSNPYSENMYAHPLSFHANAGGLGVGYPTTPVIPNDRTYEFMHKDDLTVGVDGLNSGNTVVDGWTDWTVTPLWSGAGRTLRTTIGHGVPYVYAEATGGNAKVTFNAAATVWQNNGNVLGVSINGHDYGLFAPTGANWNVTASTATSSGAFYSVAVLPSRDALATYTKYAYSFITDTKVTWAYSENTAVSTATYTAVTTPKQGTQTGTLLAEYRHQFLNSTDPVTPYTYVSPRGQMKVREGSSFTTKNTFNGVLPAMPLSGTADKTRMRASIDEAIGQGDPFNGRNDTYWTGKHLVRLASLMRIANQIGYTAGRDKLLTIVRDRLTDWLTAGANDSERLFAYDATWSTLIGYPASFGSDTELNDHHFHYSYFILAAAIVAQQDPLWATDARYGGMVKNLVKDAQNYDRNDSRFPFLRMFDVYAGHSWAAGHAAFAAGNNQESTSEGMAFSTAAIMFGTVSGDKAMRDAAIHMYTTERAAVGQYWFDIDRQVFPSTFNHRTAGMVWGNGAAYATWFSGSPEAVHGINMLPVTGGSLYHGAWKADITDNVNEIRASKGGARESEWLDIIYEFLAIADPAEALKLYNAANPAPEEGESRAHSYHWISALDTFGTPDQTVTANVPTYAVFSKNGARTYAAYNPKAAAITARFSDGQTLAVPAGSTAWRGPGGTGVDSGSGSNPPSPEPSTSVSPSASPSTDPSPSVSPSPPASPSPSPSTPPNPGGRDAYNTIEAESHDEQAGTQKDADGAGGQYLGWISNGDWVRYNGVEFGSTPARQFIATVCSGAADGISGLVEVRIDSRTSPVVGSFAVGNTGGWRNWRDIPANISGVTGTHDVYLTFASGQPADFLNINSFKFGK